MDHHPKLATLYTVDEVAEMTGMAKAWVWKGCRERTIPHQRMGRYFRFTPAQITAFMAQTETLPVEYDHLVPVRGR